MKKAKSRPVDTTRQVMSVRVSPELERRLRQTLAAGPYRVTISSLVERGIELALKELSEIRPR